MSKNIIRLFILSVVFCNGFSCGEYSSNFNAHPPACNFYYWKTQLEFSENDKRIADSLGMKKLYLRYFDVDWSPTYQMPIPVGEITQQNTYQQNYYEEMAPLFLEDYKVIPVVYLTHRVFKKEVDINLLAKNVAEKIDYLSKNLSNNLSPYWGRNVSYENAEMDWEAQYQLSDTVSKQFLANITEIQLDYDWTTTTQETYFEFLKALKIQLPNYTFSCTIRLHQFRDGEAAGIPPVDKGVLMCYNVSPPKTKETKDAIFDLDLAKAYLKQTTYPLPLEAVLPVFSWGSLFHENEFKGLASGLAETEVQNNALFTPLKDHFYQFNQDTVFSGVYMREGDVVRMDAASTEELKELVQHLANISTISEISFFDWNTSKIQQYDIQEIFNTFMDKH